MKIIDTHAHYDAEEFDEERDSLLGRELAQAGVEWVVNVGASMEGAEASAELARRFPRQRSGGAVTVYAGIGIHPDDTGIFEGKKDERGRSYAHPEEALQHLRELCAGEGIVCIGEIGLDYHWMVEEKEVQKKWFREQMRLAHELRLPINVHSRDAAQDTYDMIRENYEAGRFTGGIIHCYSGSAELAHEYVKMGYHIGIGGVVTFKNAKTLKKVVAETPLEALVTETDCPYLAPQQYRGKVSTSDMLPPVVDLIAELKGETPENVIRITSENARRVFGLD